MTPPSNVSPARSLSRLTDVVDRTKIRVMYELAEHYAGDLVRFEIGEPDFDTPRHIIDQAHGAARDGATHYTLAAGRTDLREAISEKLQRDNDIRRTTNEILVTTGAVEAVYIGLASVANPGDEVIIPTPAWSNYISQVQMLGAEPVQVPLSAADGFDLDPTLVADAITEDTAAIVLASPANPTGRVYDQDAMRAVVELAAERGVFVLADEVYEGLVYDGPRSIAPDSEYEDWILRVHSFSKTYAMTGWRVGWLTGPAELIEAATRLHLNTTTCAPSISQAAGLAALGGADGATSEMKRVYRERRDHIVERVAELPRISCPTPEGAFYVFVDVSALGGDSMEIAQDLVEEYGVVTAPGSGFGEVDGTHLRFSYASTTRETITEGLDRFERMINDRIT